MEWKLAVVNKTDHVILTPELYSAAYEAYCRSHEITEANTNLNEFIPSNAKGGDHYFSIFDLLTFG
ncbi:MAG: hypothetical protein ACXWT3_07310 [Methylococcaceae bacterium]